MLSKKKNKKNQNKRHPKKNKEIKTILSVEN